MPDHQPALLVSVPSMGVPKVTDTQKGLKKACALLSKDSGMVAIDTERAASFRYSARAYLLQIRGRQAGTFLIDPLAFKDFHALKQALSHNTWVFHAAGQDIPCLLELDLRPPALFDTEIAAQFLAFEHIGLAAVLRTVLGKDLAKEFSAVDWSTRPLPKNWLTYAALDVELLIDLACALEKLLDEHGKLSWAREEFAHICSMEIPAAKTDPWRHVSGAGKLRKPLQLAALRELWECRDRIAFKADLAPSKVLSNKAMIEIAATLPPNLSSMLALPHVSKDRRCRERSSQWMQCLNKVKALPKDQLPDRLRTEAGDLSNVRNWRQTYPKAALRLEAFRTVIADLAKELVLAHELLLAPRLIKQLAWNVPENASLSQVEQLLKDLGARSWQIENVSLELFKALKEL